MISGSDIYDKIRKAGLRATPQRVALYRVLSSHSDHPDADEIYHEVVKEIPGISPGTIYGILDVFTRKKLINKILSSQGNARYDAILESHFHLYDEESETITDYLDEELYQKIWQHLSEKGLASSEITGFNLQINIRDKNKT